MTLAILTFVATMTMVLGSYWGLVVRPEAQVSGRLRRRIQVKTDRPVGSASVVKGGVAPGVPTGLFGSVAGWHRRYAVAAAGRLIESAGMRTDPQWLIGGTAIALVLVIVTLQVVHVAWPVALAAGALTPARAVHLHQARGARAPERVRGDLSRRDQPDGAALRAGHAFTSTLAMVADEIPDPVKSEFRALYEQHNYGLPLTQVMRTFAARIPQIDVRFFSTAVLTQRETGGNLAEVLDNLANVTRDRFRVRRQLQVLTAQSRATGWVLGALPVVLGVILYILNPAQMNAFVADPTGRLLFEGAIGLEIVGVVAIRKLLQIEY